MIGKKFNKLLVVSLDRVEDYISPTGRKNKVKFFNCLCDCGIEKVIRHSKLYTTKSCGCQQTIANKSRREDLIGHKYGRLTVVELDSITGNWICSCECGGSSLTNKYDLQRGASKSCGCFQKEKVSEVSTQKFKDYRTERGFPDDVPMASNYILERLEFKPLSNIILKRDSYTCAWCSQVGMKLNVHHIEMWSVSPELRFDKNNLVTLCEDCHKDLHKYGNRTVDTIMTILLQGYANVVEEGYDFSSFELTPN